MNFNLKNILKKRFLLIIVIIIDVLWEFVMLIRNGRMLFLMVNGFMMFSKCFI